MQVCIYISTYLYLVVHHDYQCIRLCRSARAYSEKSALYGQQSATLADAMIALAKQHFPGDDVVGS